MDKDINRLREVAAAYGGQSARWPQAERAALEVAAFRETVALADASEIDGVLAAASRPEVPANGRLRLMQRIVPAKRGDTVVALPVRRRQQASWAIAAGLAASLAAGAYLGTLSQTDLLFDPGTAASDDPVDLAGLGDVNDYLGDDT
ncbi:hypothetical protein BH10PSE7_BH10PSE7_04000 [soil metagenome]